MTMATEPSSSIGTADTPNDTSGAAHKEATTTEPITTKRIEGAMMGEKIVPGMSSSLTTSVQPHSSLEIDLDTKLFFYQHPLTGAISSNPMTIRQLCRLFCPVREGMVPILAPHTRCVQVHVTASSTTTTTTEEEIMDPQQQQQQPEYSYGEWKMATEIPILQEAACTQWYYSTRSSSTTDDPSQPPAQTTEGPVSCRTLINYYNTTTTSSTSAQHQQQQQQQSPSNSPPVLVYAEHLTSEWTEIQKVTNLQLALQALSNNNNNNNNNDTTNASSTPAYGTTLEAEMGMATSNNSKDKNALDNNDATTAAAEQEVQDELEAFLSSTAGSNKKRPHGSNGVKNFGGGDDDDDDDNNDAEYESDGGTKYVKDPFTGNWIHEALAPPRPEKKKFAPMGVVTPAESNGKNKNNNTTSSNNSSGSNNNNNHTKKKHHKAKFAKRNAKCWIYVMGLPTEEEGTMSSSSSSSSVAVTEESVAQYFSKAGLLDLDAETLQPKVKLYRHATTGQLKGDASLCYARPESVELALNILDESLWDASHTLHVQRATFQAKHENGTTMGDNNNNNTISGSKPSQHEQQQQQPKYRKRKIISEAQRKVARLALLQAQDEGFGERLSGGRKGLRIIIVKHMIDNIDENRLEDEIQRHCEEYGKIEKITVISENQIVIVKYVEPSAARDAVQGLHGRKSSLKSKIPMQATYWDGVTNYATTAKSGEESRKEEQARIEDFGAWLEETQAEELPPELRLQMEHG